MNCERGNRPHAAEKGQDKPQRKKCSAGLKDKRPVGSASSPGRRDEAAIEAEVGGLLGARTSIARQQDQRATTRSAVIRNAAARLTEPRHTEAEQSRLNESRSALSRIKRIEERIEEGLWKGIKGVK